MIENSRLIHVKDRSQTITQCLKHLRGPCLRGNLVQSNLDRLKIGSKNLCPVVNTTKRPFLEHWINFKQPVQVRLSGWENPHHRERWSLHRHSYLYNWAHPCFHLRFNSGKNCKHDHKGIPQIWFEGGAQCCGYRHHFLSFWINPSIRMSTHDATPTEWVVEHSDYWSLGLEQSEVWNENDLFPKAEFERIVPFVLKWEKIVPFEKIIMNENKRVAESLFLLTWMSPFPFHIKSPNSLSKQN